MGLVQSLLSVFQDRRELLDLGSFDDDVALKVSWTPLVGGGTNMCTHKIVRTEDHMTTSLVFRTTISGYLFCAGFIGIALPWLIGFAIPHAASGGGLDGGASLIPVGFLAFGIWYAWYLHHQESIFNRLSEQFTKGAKSHDLGDVHALQLIREYVRGNKSSYYSYELNLVCHDGSRLNVVDHGSLRQIRDDAAVLASFLQVPVWDAIDYRIAEEPTDGSDIKAEILNRDQWS